MDKRYTRNRQQKAGQTDEHRTRGHAHSAGASVTGPGADIHICPMHPEVRENGPASCPKCGMSLEPETPAALTRTQYTCPMHPEIVRDEPGA